MWIDRRLSNQVLSAARQFPALVVTGGRQTGKTTLLRHLFPAASFVSLDLPSAAYQADERGEEFLRSYKEPVILDEVQYAPGLFRHLKVAIDARRAQRRAVPHDRFSEVLVDAGPFRELGRKVRGAGVGYAGER